jgi:hypothetical protein
LQRYPGQAPLADGNVMKLLNTMLLALGLPACAHAAEEL